MPTPFPLSRVMFGNTISITIKGASTIFTCEQANFKISLP